MQLRHSVNAGELFADSYGYRSGINANDAQSSRRHRAQTPPGSCRPRRASRARHRLQRWHAADSYGEPGLVRVGIDPLAEIFRQGYRADLKVRTGFFNASAYTSASGRSTARAITSIAMFYDLEDPGAFVSDIAAVLAPDGIWVLEQSYLPTMLEQNSFDTICHEHLEYYALAQIDRLVRAQGLRIFRRQLSNINGGSFQLGVPRRAPYAGDEGAIGELAERERISA